MVEQLLRRISFFDISLHSFHHKVFAQSADLVEMLYFIEVYLTVNYHVVNLFLVTPWEWGSSGEEHVGDHADAPDVYFLVVGLVVLRLFIQELSFYHFGRHVDWRSQDSF